VSQISAALEVIVASPHQGCARRPETQQPCGWHSSRFLRPRASPRRRTWPSRWRPSSAWRTDILP